MKLWGFHSSSFVAGPELQIMSFQNVEAAISLFDLWLLADAFYLSFPFFLFGFIQVQFRVTHVLGEIPCSLLSLLLCSSHFSLESWLSW